MTKSNLFLKKALLFALPITLSLTSALAETSEEFPLIFYAVPQYEQPFANVKLWGGTHVHNYQLGREVEKDREFFDRAERHGLKVMANLDGIRQIQNKVSVETMREYVREFKDHPAFGFWYFCDEPATKLEPEELEPYYRMLKEETPNVPVANAHEWQKGWDKYSKVQDILMNDAYPVTGEPFPNANLFSQTRFTRSASTLGNTLMPAIQISSWESFAKPGETEQRGFPLEELRYPNPVELRYMCFSSIAMGAKGLSFFSYARSVKVDPRWAEGHLPPLLQEIKAFAQATKAAGQIDIGPTGDAVIAGLWKGESGHWLIVANPTSETTELSLSLSPHLDSGKLTPWGSTRATSATLSGGLLTTQAEPWEVLIWEIQ